MKANTHMVVMVLLFLELNEYRNNSAFFKLTEILLRFYSLALKMFEKLLDRKRSNSVHLHKDVI